MRVIILLVLVALILAGLEILRCLNRQRKHLVEQVIVIAYQEGYSVGAANMRAVCLELQRRGLPIPDDAKVEE